MHLKRKRFVAHEFLTGPQYARVRRPIDVFAYEYAICSQLHLGKSDPSLPSVHANIKLQLPARLCKHQCQLCKHECQLCLQGSRLPDPGAAKLTCASPTCVRYLGSETNVLRRQYHDDQQTVVSVNTVEPRYPPRPWKPEHRTDYRGVLVTEGF